jgi:c(7)-type cytochrome triheme protein
MKKGADKMTMDAINKGQFCGTCHNGTKAFASNDPKRCVTCHKK